MTKQTINTQELIASQRDELSLLARMIVSKSEISVDARIEVQVPGEISDIVMIEKIQAEIANALAKQFENKEIHIFCV